MISNNKRVKLTLVKSLAGRIEKHQHTVNCLGLRKIHQSVEVNSSDPSIVGMINKVSYLLKVEEI